jgi:GntR family galactonate operon transcriptional repressor
MDRPDTKIIRLHQQVVRAIALRILHTTGEQIEQALPTEIELSQELNVSRNVVREAAKVLASKGLIEIRPKTGMRIRSRRDWNVFDADMLAWLFEVGPDEKFFQDLYDLRYVVEPAAAERAALRATGEEIAAIDNHYRMMAASIHDLEAHTLADTQFHATIIAACHNEFLEQINSTYWIALQSSFRLTGQVPDGRSNTLQYHKAILDAIQSRNPNGARLAMENLLAQVARDLQQVTRYQNIRPFSEEKQAVAK